LKTVGASDGERRYIHNLGARRRRCRRISLGIIEWGVLALGAVASAFAWRAAVNTVLVIGGLGAVAWLVLMKMAGNELTTAQLACLNSPQNPSSCTNPSAANQYCWSGCPGVMTVINKYNWLPGFGVPRPDGD
jgi:hypothetical protein